MGDLIKNLESNNPILVEESKNEIMKSLNQTKENWLVYGLIDHFLATNSAKVVEILVKVPMSHDTFIFDKLSDWIQTNEKRNHAFKLFWLIAQKHPSWLYRVTNHRLFREILNTVKTERNLITALYGLYCIIILLPIIPALMHDFLPELFTIFLVLATWKATNTPNLIGNQPVYLQNGIERLFLRLYGMYPCNFMSFLREKVSGETIKVIDPLIKNTRVHPMLLFSNPEAEKNQSRWKEMEPHDIVSECEKFSLDTGVKSQDCEQEQNDTPWCSYKEMDELVERINVQHKTNHTFAPISSTDSSSGSGTKQKVRSTNKWDNIWSPSSAVLATPPPTSTLAITHTPTPIMNFGGGGVGGQQQYGSSGASPPEAAVEATPETTPMREFSRPQRPYPVHSTAARTIWGNSSQPSSPMKFLDSTVANEKFMRMALDRNEEKHKSGHSYNDIEIQAAVCDNDDTLSIEASKEDQEVTEINKLNTNKMTDSRRTTTTTTTSDKDTRSRQNLMKNHGMKSMEDSVAADLNAMLEFEKNVKKKSDITCASNDKHTNDGKKNENSTVETQTDITMPLAWHGLLDKYVETSLKRSSAHEPSNRADMELQLLYVQLQYERYRRDVYAERNRRLLGKSRDNATLETDIDRLKSQLESLRKEHSALMRNLNEAKMTKNCTEQSLLTECNGLRDEVQMQRDTNKKLQFNIETLDRRLAEEVEEKKKYVNLLESAQAKIFEMENLLQQCQYKADVGDKYKDELQRLQQREVLMGEMKLKCGEKLVELENLRARESEIKNIKNACIEEVKELKSELAAKTSELASTKERIQNIESQLLRQNNLVADQKRCVKIVKEEYEEKLKAVEAKYSAQKAIIQRMEESILDPGKYRSNLNSEPDKSDTMGSLDHASPLSMSLASSEMSLSLKSVTEIKNLSHLLDSGSSAVFPSSSLNGESSSRLAQQVSDDIPVPTTSSHSQYYPS